MLQCQSLGLFCLIFCWLISIKDIFHVDTNINNFCSFTWSSLWFFCSHQGTYNKWNLHNIWLLDLYIKNIKTIQRFFLKSFNRKRWVCLDKKREGCNYNQGVMEIVNITFRIEQYLHKISVSKEYRKFRRSWSCFLRSLYRCESHCWTLEFLRSPQTYEIAREGLVACILSILVFSIIIGQLEETSI